MGQYIKVNGEWKHVVGFYKKINGIWTQLPQYSFDNNIYLYDPTVIDHDVLSIVGGSTYTGRQFYLVAQKNDVTTEVDWEITSGGTYASINQYGRVTIKSVANNSSITVQATRGHLTATKTIIVTYDNQLTIECADHLVGSSGNAVALYNNEAVTPTWSITSGNNYATIDSDGAITIIADGEITISATYSSYTAIKTITVEYDAGQSSSTTVDPSTGSITHSETVTTVDPQTGATTETSTSTTMNIDGTSSETTSETVTNLDGSSTTTSTTINSDGTTEQANYTTSSPDSDGAVTTVETKVVTYPAGGSMETESTVVTNEDGSSNAQHSTVTYDENGDVASSMESEVNVSAPDENGSITTETSMSILNTDGTSSESTVTDVQNEDGSATSQSETIRYDENGDVTGSTTGTTSVNADGSSASTTTNYNAEGDPTDRENIGIDTTGNVSTQDIVYDANGDPTVTGYEIDTTASEGDGKSFAGSSTSGVNTEFIPFDGSNGFEMIIKFKADQTAQPLPPTVTDTEDTSQNYLYNIMCAKSPSGSYYGIDIRWIIPKSDNTSSSAQLTARYKPSSGSQLSPNIKNLYNADIYTESGEKIYYIKFIYDPSQSQKMRIINMWTNTVISNSSNTLGSQNLELALGYAIGMQGQHYRFANVTIYEFNITKLQSS